MNNILAENLLRFGVRNLSESDVKKLEEMVLTEAFKDSNGIDWPWFKDQTSVNSLNDIILRPTVEGAYGVIFGPNAEAESIKRMGNTFTTGLRWVFWNAQALNPARPVAYIPDTMTAAINVIFKPTISKVTQLNKVAKTRFSFSSMDIFDRISDPENIKWWDSRIEFPAGSKQMMTRWQAFSKSYLEPALPEIKALYVKPPAGQPTGTPGLSKH